MSDTNCIEPAAPIIPTADALVVRERIDAMSAIYQDSQRRDWFDADDIACGIAEALDLLLSGQGF